MPEPSQGLLLARSVVRAYGCDVITGEAPGISLQDMIEVAVDNLLEETYKKMFALEKAEKICPQCNKHFFNAAYTRNVGLTTVVVCSPHCQKRKS